MSSALQSRIAVFESLAASHSDNNSLLIDAPLSAATAAALQPPVVLTPSPPKPSPSPSPPNLGRKTSLIDLDDDWTLEPDERKRGNGLLINLDSSSPPKSKPAPPSPSKKPPLPPRKPSYTSLKSAGSSSSLRSSASANTHQAFLYPPRPRPDGGQPLTVNTMQLLNNGNSKHTQASSISSFHSVSLSSDTGSTDVSTPGSISNFIATYPVDSTDSLSESFEDVSATSLSPATERKIHSEFENARAKAANRSSTQTVTLPSAMFSPQAPTPPKLPQRPSPPTSSRNSIKSPPPLPSRTLSQRTATSGGGSGSSTPRSTPASPISTPQLSSMIPTSYAVRRAPPPPPSRASYASDRSSIHSAFSTSSSGHSHNSRVLAFNHPDSSLNALASAAARTKRPTPVPLAARRRYEKVFKVNVVQRRKVLEEQKARKKREQENGFLRPESVASPGRGRRAAGWRGLSVDLITGDPDSVAEQLNSGGSSPKDKGKGRQREDSGSESEEEDLVKVRSKLFKQKDGGSGAEEAQVGPEEKLEGSVVRLVWKRSGLEKRRLAEIWCVSPVSLLQLY